MKQSILFLILFNISSIIYSQGVPSDVINFQSSGADFAPVIEVTEPAVIEWVFNDGTTSSSATPVKNYGTAGSRHNYLKVTPWSALTGINVGYDAGDEGSGGFDHVINQNVTEFQNLTLAKGSLQYLCASYNPLTNLDLREMTELKFVELLYCYGLTNLYLGSHPVLERLCVEDCNLLSLDLSGCPGLKDLRAALNQYTTINWGTTGQYLWHMCVRNNPFSVNLPDLTQFPSLEELLIWNDNQSGPFVCHSPLVTRIDAYDNHYTSADISGCTNITDFSLSGSQLTTLNLGSGGLLNYVRLNDCGLTQTQMDYVLHTLDSNNQPGGYLEIAGNAIPSAEGLVHLNNLKAKGWKVFISITNVTDITVSGAGGSSTIATDNGTLQLGVSVSPVDATDKSVTWTIENGTGQASISETGLVTAVLNGTALARATANDGSGISGTLLITISNQVIQVTGVTVIGAGGMAVITSDNGTLQMSATVLPESATNKSVTWSIENGTGQAVISSAGLVTAVANGNVIAKATANDGTGIYGTLLLTISNQSVSVTGITVTGTGGVTSISTDNGTLQLNAAVLPINAADKSVTWSLTAGTGQATISGSGLVTAIANGTVTARATANDGSGVAGTLVITISNQVTPVTAITVTGAGGASIIAVDNGTLQLTATVLPANATNKTVTWSLTNGTGQGTISPAGLVTAIADGTVTARATANDGTGVYGTIIITIASQTTPVTAITVTGAGGFTAITVDNGTLQLTASVLPVNASDRSVTWSEVDGTGSATINTSGTLSAISNGTVTARATANDGSGIFGMITITISGQILSVTGITVTSDAGATAITADDGTLQLNAVVLPANATERTVVWTIENGTGEALIDASGLVTAVTDGTVTARATAKDGSGVSGILVLTLSGQLIPVTGIRVTSENGTNIINTGNGSLQLSAEVVPDNATNKSVTWSVANITGLATISPSGLVTAVDNGVVTAQANASDGSGIYGTMDISIEINLQKPFSVIVTSDQIRIIFYEDYVSSVAGLYNLQGTLMMRKTVDSNVVVFNTFSISSGLYIIVVSKGDVLFVEKVMII
jgi:uncharacterized protein YjdB